MSSENENGASLGMLLH